METKNKLIKLWDELEKQNSLGLIKRLYSSDIEQYIYVTFQFIENYYGIAFSFNKTIKLDISSLKSLTDLRISLINDTLFCNSQLLVIQLVDPSYKDIFSTLCESLIQSVISIQSDVIATNEILTQIHKWKQLFENSRNYILTLQEQQGLYGELFLLRKMLLANQQPAFKILNTWVGADKALQDFQGDTWALEVKTSSTSNPQKITINSERQLDDSLLDNLLLFHLSVEVSAQNGESINDIIEQIRDILKNDISNKNSFNAKLLLVGYYDHQSNHYDNRKYKIRNESYYEVQNKFPRIKEADLLNGICDVKYSIFLSTCEDSLVTENYIFKIIVPNE